MRMQVRRLRLLYAYCTENVWRDSRNVWHVKLLKIVNLSVRSFFDKNIQTLSSSLTYTTLLAVIPTLSLLLAVAKGFGLQNLLVHELYLFLPSQKAMLDNSLEFVDKFLSTLSHGVFVGIGVVFLVWTLVSLLRKIETAYNKVWDVRKGRSFYRMLTDYTAIMLILPILLICSGGLTVFLSEFVQTEMRMSSGGVLPPFLKFLLDLSPILLLCVFFVAMNVLMPYTKVKVRNAILPGLVCGLLFYLIQQAYVSGQISVMRYNAVYGSFAFLPLFLIWMHISWTVCIACAVMTYASQNFFRFNYSNQISAASSRYMEELSLYVTAIAARRFEDGLTPYGKKDFADQKQLPIRMVNVIVDKLTDGGLLSATIDAEGNVQYQPAMNLSKLTVSQFMDKYRSIGYSDFIEEREVTLPLERIRELLDPAGEAYRTVRISEIL